MRPLLSLTKGRMSSIDAPVVPIKFEMIAPQISTMVLTIGVAFLSTSILIPPEATNKAVSREINWKYSNKACIGPWVFSNTNK